MNNAKREKEARLLHFKELYEGALLYADSYREQMLRNMSQYLGSDEIDGSDERATTVRNITYEIIESQVSADIPAPKVESAVYTELRDKNARSIERLCRSLRTSLPLAQINEKDERYTYIYGSSIFYVEWDVSHREGSSEGGVRLHVISPLDFIPQPAIDELCDMEYCFLRFTTTREELIKKYSVKEDEVQLAECEYRSSDGTLADTVTLIVAFYKDENGEVGRFVFSGDLVLSDLPEYYKRKLAVCKTCGSTREACSCAKRDIEYINIECESVITQDGKAVTLPYYTPKDFPLVIRNNTLGDSLLFGGSDCERIRPQQQAINKIESRILQKLLRAGITPIMPEGTAITLSNAIFGQVIKTRPGESIDSYGKMDTTPDISQDVIMADRLYDHAKRVLGISDALQGTDTTNVESGYARQLKLAQASSRLETKKRMKQLAYSKLYKLIFEHYLAFADEPQRLAFADGFGRMHFSEFNRHDFIECDKYGEYYYDDGYLFSVDTEADTNYAKENVWERNLNNLERGALGDSSDPLTLLHYWQLQERAHYPFAKDNVEYFTDLVTKRGKNQTQNNYESENANG